MDWKEIESDQQVVSESTELKYMLSMTVTESGFELDGKTAKFTAGSTALLK